MNVCIIGGTGHIGGHLVPMFVRDGAGVTVVTRGRAPAPDDGPWQSVRCVRAAYVAGDPAWPRSLRDAAAGADVLIDLLGVDLAASYEAARGICRHVVACGSVWMLGTPRRVPCPPVAQNEFPGEAYARRWRVIQDVLRRSTAGDDAPAFTAVLPPNICGPGKIPLEPYGGRSVDVHRAMAAGRAVTLPEGSDVLIGPCDAEDVAQGFFLAATKPEASAGRVFNVGSAYALTASQFVATYADIYGVEIPVRRVDWSTFAREVVPDAGARYHFEAHMCPDIGETRTVLGYAPRFTPEESMRRAVEWMRANRML